MKGYLLDTSICVAIFRGNRQVAAKLNNVSKEQCFVSLGGQQIRRLPS